MRTGKQCRERWLYHLNPCIKKTSWSLDEERVMCAMVAQIGNRWSEISRHLKGRSDNCIKNHFYSGLRKALRWVNRAIASESSHRQLKPIKDELISRLVSNALPKDGHSELRETMADLKHRLY